MLELSEVAAAWPWGASLALVALARGFGAGRRRAALNEALHELRRPLQTLALVAPTAQAGPGSPLEGSLQLAATALERLEREINGDPAGGLQAPVFVAPLLASAVARWRPQVALSGGSLQLHERDFEPIVLGDRRRLAQAFDNLLANAVEHGGSDIEAAAAADARKVRITVRDSGRHRGPGRGRVSRRTLARLTGRHRHGHGLKVVRRVAGEHGGGFELHCSDRGTEAVLELPLHGRVEAPR